MRWCAVMLLAAALVDPCAAAAKTPRTSYGEPALAEIIISSKAKTRARTRAKTKLVVPISEAGSEAQDSPSLRTSLLQSRTGSRRLDSCYVPSTYSGCISRSDCNVVWQDRTSECLVMAGSLK